MSQNEQQQQLRLPAQPRPATVELLFRTFGTVLIPLEDLRARYFRNLNSERFERVIGTERLPIPVTTLDGSTKALRFVEIHQLAAHIEHCSNQADTDLERRLNKQDE